MSAQSFHGSAPYCVVLTTCASSEDAGKLATTLLEQQLAACVQVLDINSYYTWKGEIANEPEKLLLIKTKTALYDQVQTSLRTVHPYEVPEIVCLPMVAGLPAYLGWIDEVTTEGKPLQADA